MVEEVIKDWSKYGVQNNQLKKLKHRQWSNDDSLTLVVVGAPVTSTTQPRPSDNKKRRIVKWQGVVSDGSRSMLAFFLARTLDENLSETLPVGSIINSLEFVAERQEVDNHIVYCDLRFVFYDKKKTMVPKEDMMSLNDIVDVTRQMEEKEIGQDNEPNETSHDSVMSRSVVFDKEAPNCCGVACSSALNASREARSEAPDGSHVDVINKCLATHELPTMEAMAAMNPYYEPDKYGSVAQLPGPLKRMCLYFYFAVHYLDAQEQRIQLPCCVRYLVHNMYPCEMTECTRRNCPTHSDVFHDIFGYPEEFDAVTPSEDEE